MDAETPLWEHCQHLIAGERRFQLFLTSPQLEIVHQIRFPPRHDDYMAEHGHETRRKLRRLTRKLIEQKGARWERVTAPSQVPKFLERLDEVFRNSWQAKTFGYRPRNTEAERRFLTLMAEHGWLRSYVLLSDDTPIAFELGYQYHNVLYRSDCGFSQEWAEFGPGTALLHLSIEDLFRENPPGVYDFGLGDAAYKRSLANAQRRAASVYLASKWFCRWLLHGQNALNRFEQSIRALFVTLRIDRLIRKIVKHQK